jgi:hypothetical protein
MLFGIGYVLYKDYLSITSYYILLMQFSTHQFNGYFMNDKYTRAL